MHLAQVDDCSLLAALGFERFVMSSAGDFFVSLTSSAWN
jgi:hypothetical protein